MKVVNLGEITKKRAERSLTKVRQLVRKKEYDLKGGGYWLTHFALHEICNKKDVSLIPAFSRNPKGSPVGYLIFT